MVIHKKSAPYHPQANGQAESTNKILCTVLTKIVGQSRTDWEMKLNSALWAYRVAYKTAIGTTPFNMVFGLDAILPLEFLIPTLRVAKELDWNGHEFSQRLTELEQLDEFRLKAVAGMYAQKRRLKKFHDSHILNKDFKKGDLVLAYTLKQHNSKLKKRGMGPYVIYDLSSSGAVHLATLDGQPMTSWISGCRIKKYHEPLTENILTRLHATKERKAQEHARKIQAQVEAKERAAKLRRARTGTSDLEKQTKKLRICTLQDEDAQTNTLKPYIYVRIGEQSRLEGALFDTGASVNSLCYDSWEAIGKPELTPSTTKLTSFVGATKAVEGYLDLPLFIGATNVTHRFYVMKPGKVSTSVIIGQPWQRKYNGTPNWRREGITFESDGARLFAPFISNEDFTTDDESDEESIQETTKDKEQASPSITTAPAQAPQAQPLTKQMATSNKGIWIPKKLYHAQQNQQQIWVPKNAAQRFAHSQAINANANKPTRKATYRRTQRKESVHQQTNKHKMTPKWPITQPTKIQQRWISKTVLQEQSFYQGAEYIWLPKRVNRKQTKPLNKKVSRTAETYVPQTKHRQKWISKQVLQQQGYYKGSTHMWLPKSIPNSTTTKTQKKTEKQAEPYIQLPNYQQRWVPKQVLHHQNYYEGTTNIWLPKNRQPSKRNVALPTRLAPTKEKKTTQKWIPKDSQAAQRKVPTLPTSNQTGKQVTTTPAKKWKTKASTNSIKESTSQTMPTAKDDKEEEKEVKNQMVRAPPSNSARHLIYLLLTHKNDKFAKLWQTYFTAVQRSTNAASTAEALGPHLLQDPSLAPH